MSSLNSGFRSIRCGSGRCPPAPAQPNAPDGQIDEQHQTTSGLSAESQQPQFGATGAVRQGKWKRDSGGTGEQNQEEQQSHPHPPGGGDGVVYGRQGNQGIKQQGGGQAADGIPDAIDEKETQVGQLCGKSDLIQRQREIHDQQG